MPKSKKDVMMNNLLNDVMSQRQQQIWLNNAVDWILNVENRERIQFSIVKENKSFDYPEYLGMPDNLYKNLDSCSVDTIQEIVDRLKEILSK